MVKNRKWYFRGREEVGRVRLELRVTLEVWDVAAIGRVPPA